MFICKSEEIFIWVGHAARVGAEKNKWRRYLIRNMKKKYPLRQLLPYVRDYYWYLREKSIWVGGNEFTWLEWQAFVSEVMSLLKYSNFLISMWGGRSRSTVSFSWGLEFIPRPVDPVLWPIPGTLSPGTSLNSTSNQVMISSFLILSNL